MPHPDLLLARLEEIGISLARSGRALALLALGSAGRDLERLDEYSDLDFFAIVVPGAKASFLADLDWLTSLAPVTFAFRNTADGYKLLYADGVFCEFAVLEPDELPGIPFTPGRVVWKSDDVDDDALLPDGVPASPAIDVDWHLGEALTALYVGLGRFRRGEKLTAARLVQGAAVDRVLDLATTLEPGAATNRDPFTNDRRVEQRLPRAAAHLADFVQGYDRTPESAIAILTFLDDHFSVEPRTKEAVLTLCRG